MDSAYAAYDLALKYNGENINVLNNYSYFLALEGIRLDQAERMMSIVIRKQPDVATYLDTYAWVYFRLGNFSLAKFYQKRALTCEGEQPSATLLEHYGDILYGSGETEEAMEYWKRAAALPDCDSKTLPEKIRTGKYIEEPLPWAK
jgi:Tfp pilus assembly protein PilF